MEYIIDICDESLKDFIEKIAGVYSIERYVPGDEVCYYRDLLESAREVIGNADYVELISLRKENEKLRVFERLIRMIEKEIDIEKYINELSV